VELDGEGDQKALADLVSGLLSEPLDMHRSPWQFHLVDGTAKGAALVARLHTASPTASRCERPALPHGRDRRTTEPDVSAAAGRGARPGLARRVTEGRET
jgi:hypothetical protein